MEWTEGNATMTAESVPNEVRTTLTTASRMSELTQPPHTEKIPLNMVKFPSPFETHREAEKIARRLHILPYDIVMKENTLTTKNRQAGSDHQESIELDARAETMEEIIKNVETFQSKENETKVRQQNMHIWEGKRKKELEKEIGELVERRHVAQNHFNSTYHVSIYEASFEIKRIRKKARLKEVESEKKTAEIPELQKELDALNAEYRNVRQFADNHPDRELIYNLLEQMREPLVSVRDNLRQVQVERNIDKKQRGRSR
jgi:hypothetical protein